ncbi:hypothetical protein BDN70DRAFT_929091 [Pholiota conissans]|uniref:BTB domain-containing protein n=1 Tax=Pholiota conissans TaxID=109636 RepID=A0A9P5ZAF7_9AGAR|nr:hypothetical protein BDN70DRAFT_929091 [Pholiota conissans]
MDSDTPRKRRRVDPENGEDEDDKAGSAQEEKPIVRDEEYYKDNGDCVIRVRNVLFKIHRHLLDRDASAFSNMFSLPQGTEGTQGATDDDPLVLYDDADDFRALCWIIYALPTVYLQQSEVAEANLKNLVALYLISQKYHFEAHEKYARKLLSKHCSTLACTILRCDMNKYYLFSCPETRLASLLRIATLTDEPVKEYEKTLSSSIQDVWTSRLTNCNQSAAFAIGVGSELGLRKFVAGLYYLEMTRMKADHLSGSIAYSHPTNDLTLKQNFVLFKGSWSLHCYWLEMYRKSQLFKTFDCDHGCSHAYKESWRQIMVLQPTKTFDPVNRLGLLVNFLDLYATKGSGEDQFCCASQTLKDMQEALVCSFAEHFLGPEVSDQTPEA